MTDAHLKALMSPQPTIVALSLVDNPDYVKCPRCWHYTHEGLHNHDNLCDRCCNVLLSDFPDHESIPHIKESRERQKQQFTTELT
jgi:hypothetical protein